MSGEVGPSRSLWDEELVVERQRNGGSARLVEILLSQSRGSCSTSDAEIRRKWDARFASLDAVCSNGSFISAPLARQLTRPSH